MYKSKKKNSKRSHGKLTLPCWLFPSKAEKKFTDALNPIYAIPSYQTFKINI